MQRFTSYLPLCLVLLFLCFNLDGLAQSKSFDVTQVDRNIKALFKRSPDSAAMMIEHYLEQSRKEKRVLAECHFLYLKAEVMRKQGNQQRSMELQRALIAFVQNYQGEKTEFEEKRMEIFRGDALVKIGRSFIAMGQYDSTVYYMEKALAVYQAYDYRQGIIQAYSILIAVYNYSGELTKALAVIEKSIAICKKHDLKESLTSSYHNMATILKGMGRLDEALETLLEALPVAKELEAKYVEISVLAGIGQIYYALSEPEQALHYTKQSIALARSTQDTDNLASSLIDAGDAYQKLAMYDSAMLAYQEGLSLYEQLEGKSWQAYTLQRISSLLIEQKQAKKALEYIKKGLAITQSLDLPQEELLLLTDEIKVDLMLNRNASALQKVPKLQKMAESTEDLSFQKTAYSQIHSAYTANGKHKEANRYLLKYLHVKDSLNSAEEARKIARIEYKFKLDQKTAQLEAEQAQKDLVYQQELERERWIRYSSFGGILLLLTITFIIYRFYRLKKRANIQLAHQANILELRNEELQVLREKEQEMMEKERAYMEENISSKERQLATITMLSHEKNALLNQLLAQVREVKEQVDDVAITGLKAAERLIQKNLNMKNSWETFVYQFEHVHPDFFKKIKEQHPTISPTELKTSAYIKIGFSNKEIAQVTNMATTTIKKNVSRLKKRLELGAEVNVRDYILRL